MKGAIASVEIFVQRGDEPVERLSLVVSAPIVSSASADRKWICRVALANLHRATEIEGADSVEALSRALARGRDWLVGLQDEGFALYRDREQQLPYMADTPG